MTKNKENPCLLGLNPLQKEAVKSDKKRLLVLAGAGSGKTKTLIQRILYLLSSKLAEPSDILAITFTKNAANEMIDRLILAGKKNLRLIFFPKCPSISHLRPGRFLM